MRTMALALGVLTLMVVWLGPLPELAPRRFSAHMTMHMGVVAVAAPLMAMGVAGRRFDPAARFPRLLGPIPASMVELVVVWIWHLPALHHVARSSLSGLVIEQSTFLAAGLLLWVSALGGQRDRESRTASGIVALLLTSMHMTLLGALIALSPRVLYAHAAGLAELNEQHIGGVIMLLVGGVAYLAGGLALTARLVRHPAHAREGLE